MMHLVKFMVSKHSDKKLKILLKFLDKVIVGICGGILLKQIQMIF